MEALSGSLFRSRQKKNIRSLFQTSLWRLTPPFVWFHLKRNHIKGFSLLLAGTVNPPLLQLEKALQDSSLAWFFLFLLYVTLGPHDSHTTRPSTHTPTTQLLSFDPNCRNFAFSLPLLKLNERELSSCSTVMFSMKHVLTGQVVIVTFS